MSKQIGNPPEASSVLSGMPTPPPDDASVSKAPPHERVSDEEFEALLMASLEPAYRLALRLSGNSEDAQDLVQEAALRASRFRHTFQRGTSFKSWFYRIIVNQFRSEERRVGKECRSRWAPDP